MSLRRRRRRRARRRRWRAREARAWRRRRRTRETRAWRRQWRARETRAWRRRRRQRRSWRRWGRTRWRRVAPQTREPCLFRARIVLKIKEREEREEEHKLESAPVARLHAHNIVVENVDRGRVAARHGPVARDPVSRTRTRYRGPTGGSPCTHTRAPQRRAAPCATGMFGC